MAKTGSQKYDPFLSYIYIHTQQESRLLSSEKRPMSNTASQHPHNNNEGFCSGTPLEAMEECNTHFGLLD